MMPRVYLRFVIFLFVLSLTDEANGLAFVNRIMTGFGRAITPITSFSATFSGTAPMVPTSSGSALLAHNGKLLNKKPEEELVIVDTTLSQFGLDEDTQNQRKQTRDLVYEQILQRMNSL